MPPARIGDRRTLVRERLLALVPRIWEHRVALVVAPAGSGKTTLLEQVAAAAGTRAVYHLAEPEQAEEQAFLAAVERSLGHALDAVPEPTLLVVDDFHFLSGTPAEAAVERLLARAPEELAVVLASRVRPQLNWSRLLVSGSLLEIGPDDLRFRSWEIERLFREVYAEPLPPADLAVLERRTDGWAAGLMLFHMATRGQPLADRRRTLASLQMHWRLAREYLTRNVL
ncbi:MAG: transcriptional regulator, partial [Actinobacteria bacterium]|nr:transcriptional regulator [Actinomycetota bacterium]